MNIALAAALVVAVLALLASLASLRHAHGDLESVERRAAVAETLLHHEALDEAMYAVLKQASQWSHAEAALLILLSTTEPDRCFTLALTEGALSPLAAEDVGPDVSDVAALLKDHGVVALSGGHADPRLTRFAAAHGLRNGGVAPLAHGGEIIGVLALGNGANPARHDLHRLDDVARQLSTALAEGHLRSAHAHLADRGVGDSDNLDPNTGLPNRTLLLELVERALSERGRSGHDLALLAVAVNIGAAGSRRHQILSEVAERLSSVLRRGDTAARIGEESFAILLTDLLDDAEGSRIAERIIEQLDPAQPDALTTRAASIGVRLVTPAEVVTAGTVIRDAEAALQHAYHRGGGHHRHSKDSALTEQMQALVDDLRKALDEEALTLNYQPIVDLESGAVLGAEALVRWVHPSRGPIPPLEFLGLAEEAGLASQLGGLVLREACRQMLRWQTEFTRTTPLAISVNISPAHLRADDFAAQVLGIVEEFGVEPGCVILEFSEDLLLQDLAAATTILDPLQRAGLHLAVDDVGTGHATLEYLRRLPVDILKIGRPFIEALVDEDPAIGTAHAIVEQGNKLRMQLVAEGVENAVQVSRLRDLGCTMAQGYHLIRPTDVEGMDQLLRQGPIDIAVASAEAS